MITALELMELGKLEKSPSQAPCSRYSFGISLNASKKIRILNLELRSIKESPAGKDASTRLRRSPR